MKPLTQLIWAGDRYEEADASNSEIPSWPVQDEGGNWHYREFRGQRVAYIRSTVSFGFRCREMSEQAIAKLDMDDLPSDVYITNNSVYRWIES